MRWEAMCVQSTLFLSLQREHGKHTYHFEPYLPDDGVLLSPSVEIFRSGSDDGYRFLEEPRRVDVISLAMPNYNHRVSDSRVCNIPQNGQAYAAMIQKKFEVALLAAIKCRADVVIFPAVGCGVFRNDPKRVGELLRAALNSNSVRGRIPHLILSGDKTFCHAVSGSEGSSDGFCSPQ